MKMFDIWPYFYYMFPRMYQNIFMFFWLRVNMWYLSDHYLCKILAKFRYNVNKIEGTSIKKVLLIGYVETDNEN